MLMYTDGRKSRIVVRQAETDVLSAHNTVIRSEGAENNFRRVARRVTETPMSRKVVIFALILPAVAVLIVIKLIFVVFTD